MPDIGDRGAATGFVPRPLFVINRGVAVNHFDSLLGDCRLIPHARRDRDPGSPLSKADAARLFGQFAPLRPRGVEKCNGAVARNDSGEIRAAAPGHFRKRPLQPIS